MMLRSTSPWPGGPGLVAEAAATTPAELEVELAELHRRRAAFLDIDRVALLRALGEALRRHRSGLIELLVAEAGKTTVDAGNEADALPRKVVMTLAALDQRTPSAIPASGAGVVWRPRGVAACIGPYNFPLHLLHGLVVPALAVGCPVVAKPSERCPGLGLLYRTLVAESGLAPWCRVVLGGSDLAAWLAGDPRIATVAAVGGKAMGAALARIAGGRPELVLALELGGINPALVLDDVVGAEREAAATAIADGAWRLAGQRCNATRRVHVPRADLPWWRERLAQERLRLRPGADPAATVGPMIDAAVRERFQQPWRKLPPELALIAGDPASPGDGDARADPLLAEITAPAGRAHALITEESFGPALVLDGYDDADEAVARLAANPWRLSCSLWTPDRARFRALAPHLPYGLLGHNRSTAGALPELPFGGCGVSGNGRPAAIAAAAIFADETAIW